MYQVTDQRPCALLGKRKNQGRLKKVGTALFS
jgi:hypothetical protein